MTDHPANGQPIANEWSDWPQFSDYEDPNQWFTVALAKATERLIAAGFSDDEASANAADVVIKMIAESAPDYAVAMEGQGKAFVLEMADYRRGFVERLRTHWGDALDLYEVVVEAVASRGVVFSKRNVGSSGHRDLLLDVLVQLNGQAVRVAREVLALVSAGFPLGALALARTLHEIAVRAAILAEFGVTDAYTDLAEKFMRHDRVLTYKDAVVYQRDAQALGYERIEQAVLDKLAADHDALVEKYGKAYKSTYGWASGLPGLPGEPTFDRLEQVASLGHHRGLYKWASHFVHADARSLALNMVERGGTSAVLTNATNTMLADPGQQALGSLYRVFVSLVTSAETFALYDQLLCQSLRILVDEADSLFVKGEQAVDDAEVRLQAELAERGLRFDLIRGEVLLDEGPHAN